MSYQRHRNALANVSTDDLKALLADVESQSSLPANENMARAIKDELATRNLQSGHYSDKMDYVRL